jgi:hypothetical protein
MGEYLHDLRESPVCVGENDFFEYLSIFSKKMVQMV